MNRFSMLRKLVDIEGEYGILAPTHCSDNFLSHLRTVDKPYFLDCGVFQQQTCPWYCRIDCHYDKGQWHRDVLLLEEPELRLQIRNFLERYDRFSPDYAFAPDVIGEPLLSLYLARLALEEYARKPRYYKLIGVVQVGAILYNWNQSWNCQNDSFLPHYHNPGSFLAPMISEYRRQGFEYVALGGLLKADPSMPMGLKFGLDNEQLDNLLTWSRIDFVLGGLALTRIPILRKHGVWADSTNWVWWDARYDQKRFGNRNAVQDVVVV